MYAVGIHAGAWTHYGYVVRDAMKIVTEPLVEIHMSTVHACQECRHHSLFVEIVKDQICGFGLDGHQRGLQAVVSTAAIHQT